MKRLFFTAFLVFASLAFSEDGETQPLPRGYDGINLGMSVEEVEKLLEDRLEFGFRGESDVSFLPLKERTLIATDGGRYLAACYFQFSENRLYNIAIGFQSGKVSFYTAFAKLREKYGEPTSVTPEKMAWEDDEVAVALERPCVVRYIDKDIFDGINAASQVEKSRDEKTKGEFVNAL